MFSEVGCYDCSRKFFLVCFFVFCVSLSVFPLSCLCRLVCIIDERGLLNWFWSLVLVLAGDWLFPEVTCYINGQDGGQRWAASIPHLPLLPTGTLCSAISFSYIVLPL